MSWIEIRNNATLAQAQSATSLSKKSGPDAAASGAAASRVFQLQQNREQSRKVQTKKAKRLHSPSDISESDLQPLTGKKRDDVIGELTRILVSIQDYESGEGEDETTQLCKMMLGEHVRRLTLVKGTQIASDGLKGNA